MFDAAILDVDGVLTQTAAVHERAWKETLDRVLVEHGVAAPFSRTDYLEHVDGKPRLDGLRDFLASRAITVDDERARALADEKNRVFLGLLDQEGVRVFDDAVRQVRHLRAHGLAIAFVSSSRNASRVLSAAGLDQLCDVLVDGQTAEEQGLHGKPDIFREAIRRLEVEPPNAIVVEDAVAGVKAAAEVGSGLVIGVARNGGHDLLLAAGANRVVQHLGELDFVVEPGSRPSRALPSALSAGALEERLQGRRPVLFLDFDGTLSPIVEHPGDARLDATLRAAIDQLSQRCTVAVVSGRDREDVERRVGICGIWYAGSHGLDLRSPSGETFAPAGAHEAVAELDQAATLAERELSSLEGIVIEKKRFAVAVHYRMAGRDDGEHAIRFVRALAGSSPHLVMRAAERVVELRPNIPWDKGRAVEHMLGELGDAGFPIYLGDGHTDEDAFRSFRHRGLGVLVGAVRRPTHADLRLEGPTEVGAFLALLCEHLSRPGGQPDWSLVFDRWEPESERIREALCTLGNGRFATRGAAAESRANPKQYPGTYLAGGYDRVASEIDGQVVVQEDLVNWPNWLPLTFRPDGGEWLSIDRFDLLEYKQELDLRRGILHRRFRVRDKNGRETEVASRRLVSMDDPHVAAEAWDIVPVDWSGGIEIRSSLDGSVSNDGVARYRELNGQHLVPEDTGRDERASWLVVRTRQSRLRLAEVARTRVHNGKADVRRRTEEHVDRVEDFFELEAEKGHPVHLEKVVAIHGSRDRAISDPLADALERMDTLSNFEDLAAAHERSWARLWNRFDIDLGRDQVEANRLLRLHIFHLLQVASPHVVDHDVGVPARGLHGEAYRGHVFWDELFIFPFLNYSMPELTRELLFYRYRRLEAARKNAQRLGLAGAAYPWQSGSNGREESPAIHQNPLSGRWVPDETHLQRHIDAAIAYNIWQYHAATGDGEFLSFYGAEMLIEIARFWASLAQFDDALGRYRIRGVIGPDEFHTRSPGAARAGLDDNTYTNVMAAWCLRVAERALHELGDDRRRELLDQLRVTDEDRLHWQEVASRMRVVFLPEGPGVPAGRILSQFDGYANLEELDWEAYRTRYGDIQRIDRILEKEHDTPARYKASKQADVLMLFYLFSADELVSLFASMGYELEPSSIPENVDYYLKRTSHGSTLSRIVHAWVLARSDRPRSYRLFQEALRSDVADVQGGTTSEGVHLGAMAGTVDLAKRGYTGAVIRDGVLWFDPSLPDEVGDLRTRFRVRGAWLDVHVDHETLEIELTSGAPTARVGIAGRVHELMRGQRRSFPLEPPQEPRVGAQEAARHLESELASAAP